MRTESFDKWTSEPCFSCGTDCMEWMTRNCDICIKNVVDRDDGLPVKWRCQVQFEIQAQVVGVNESKVSHRTKRICQMDTCPYLRTERYPRRKTSKKTTDKIKSLFDL